MTARYSLREARQALDLTVKQLAREADISVSAIYSIEKGKPDGYCVNSDTASLIATALGCKVEEIDWPHGLSNRGRPPQTGKDAVTSQRRATNACPKCFTQLPVSGHCDYCG